MLTAENKIRCSDIVVDLVHSLNEQGQHGDFEVYSAASDIAAFMTRDGVRFGIHVDHSNREKIVIGVALPREWYNGGWPTVYVGHEKLEQPSISMSAAKPSHLKARDFKNRLLGPGVQYYRLCQQKCTAERDYEQLSLKTIKDLAALEGQVPCNYDLQHKQLNLGKQMKVQVYGDQVNAEVRNLSVEKVKKIMAILKEPDSAISPQS